MLKRLFNDTGIKIVVSVYNNEVRYGVYTDDNDFIVDLSKSDVLEYINELEKEVK